MGWGDIPLATGVLQNVTETALKAGVATLENAYLTEADSLARFPGLRTFAEIEGDDGRVYLTDYKNDLMAVTSRGRMYRIGSQGEVEDVTTFGITGAGRPVFAETDQDLLVCAGGPIVRFAGHRTSRLSAQAPDASHVAYIGGFVAALEPRNGRFQHSAAGQYDVWNPLDSFAAEGRPDALTALIATSGGGQLLLAGPKSVETFEQSAGGDKPFFRRDVLPYGVSAPSTLTDDPLGTFAVTDQFSFAGLATSSATALSRAVQLMMDAVSDWRDAWATAVQAAGQQFVILQAPYAVTPYETEGLTLVLDIARKAWFYLYGWDADLGRPARWPGWSIHKFNGRTFVGGEGRIYELTKDAYDNAGLPQRVLWRSAHMQASGGEIHVQNVRVRVERGHGATAAAVSPVMSFRVNRDNRGFGRYKRIDMGRRSDRHMIRYLGPMGYGRTVQMEVSITDAVPFEMAALEWETEVVPR
jgi:hypothetical protein